MGLFMLPRRRTFRRVYDELASRLGDAAYLRARNTYDVAYHSSRTGRTRSSKNVVVAMGLPVDSRQRASEATLTEEQKGSALTAWENWRQGTDEAAKSSSTEGGVASSSRSTVPLSSLLQERYPYSRNRSRDAEPGAHKMFVLFEATWASLLERSPEMHDICDAADLGRLMTLLSKATNKGRGAGKRRSMSLGDIRDPAISPTLDMLERAAAAASLDTSCWSLLREMNALAAPSLASADLTDLVAGGSGAGVEAISRMRPPRRGCLGFLRAPPRRPALDEEETDAMDGSRRGECPWPANCPRTPFIACDDDVHFVSGWP